MSRSQYGKSKEFEGTTKVNRSKRTAAVKSKKAESSRLSNLSGPAQRVQDDPVPHPAAAIRADCPPLIPRVIHEQGVFYARLSRDYLPILRIRDTAIRIIIIARSGGGGGGRLISRKLSRTRTLVDQTAVVSHMVWTTSGRN